MAIESHFTDDEYFVRLTSLRVGDTFVFDCTPYLLVSWDGGFNDAHCTNLMTGYPRLVSRSEMVQKKDFMITITTLPNPIVEKEEGD